MPWHGLSLGLIIVACQRNIPSPTGPAEYSSLLSYFMLPRQPVSIRALITLCYNYVFGCKTPIYRVEATAVFFTIIISVYTGQCLAHGMYIFVEWMNENIKIFSCCWPSLILWNSGLFLGSVRVSFPYSLRYFNIFLQCRPGLYYIGETGLIVWEDYIWQQYKHLPQGLVPRNCLINIFLLFEVSSSIRE